MRFHWSGAFGKGLPHNEDADAARVGDVLGVSSPASEGAARSPDPR